MTISLVFFMLMQRIFFSAPTQQMSHLLFTIWQCRCFTDMSHNQPPSSRRLCKMATCDISENTHEIICYQYVEHASSLRIRQKLLVQSEGHLTLVMVNKMACQMDGAHTHRLSQQSPKLPLIIRRSQNANSTPKQRITLPTPLQHYIGLMFQMWFVSSLALQAVLS